MTTKLTNKSIVVILAILATVVFAMSPQQALGRDDPNANSPKAAKNDANGHVGMRHSIEDRVEELNKELGLTEQQKKEVRSIFENERKDLRVVMIDQSLAKEQKWEKINAILQITKEQLNRILTPEQQEKYAKMKADVREDGPEFAERHIERMSEKLSLTGQQKKDITPIIQSEMKEVQAIMNDKSLAKEQKWEKIDALHLTTKERLSRILTPEQQKKYAEMETDIHKDGQEFVERHIERISEKLGLTGQQKKDITPIIKSEMKEVRAVMSNKSLAKEQKWEKIDAIHQTTKEQLSRILTLEQQKKYAEMENQAHERTADHSSQGDKSCQQKPVDSNSK